MRDVYLHGTLGAKYGEKFQFEVDTVVDAVRAMTANFPEFIIDLREGSYNIVRGEDIDTGMCLDEEQIAGMRLGSAPLHILPVVAGSKNGGAMKAVVGIGLIAMSMGTFGMAGFLASPMMGVAGATTYGGMAGMMGLSMAVAGVSGMLAPEPTGQEAVESSFLLSGVMGLAPEGTAIPLVYGQEILVKGMTVSALVNIDRIDRAGNTTTPFETNKLRLTEIFGSSAVTG